MNILITGVGGPTPRSFAHSLKTFGTHFRDATLVGTDINPLATGLYQKDLFTHTRVIPRADHPDYRAAIEQIVNEYRIDSAVIQPEFEVKVWSRFAAEGTLPCKAFLPAPEINELLVDKSEMTKVLAGMDLVPPSAAFHRDEKDLDHLFDTLGNDFWVRSSSGTSGLGSLRVDGRRSLENWILINPDVQYFLASTYLPGRNLACKLLYWKGKLLRSACGERVHYIMSKVAPSGITGNTSFGRLLNEPDLVDTAVKAMDRIFEVSGSEKHGFYTVDFKEDAHGKPYITEVNVRHVAFTQCFAAGGANFAEDSVRLLNGDPDFDHNYKMYEFESGTIFLRDVDERPILMKESELLGKV